MLLFSMPEQFEHLVGKKEEKRSEEKGSSKEIPPEKHQKALGYAEELKKIKEIEFPTDEDLKKVSELIRRIEMICSGEENPFSELFNLEVNEELARERLEELKETPLWDKERKQWNEHMNENQELKGSDRYPSAQLLGILAEAIIVEKK